VRSALGRRLLIGSGAVLVVLFVVVEFMVLGSWGDDRRNMRAFQRTTDATTSLANAQRQVFTLTREVDRLRPGASLDKVALQRGLLERQLAIVQASAPAQRTLQAQVHGIQRSIARFDSVFSQVYGDGTGAVSDHGHKQVDRALERLELDVKRTFDEEEHVLYARLATTLGEEADQGLLLVVFSGLLLVLSAALAVIIARSVRGRYARASLMLDRSEERFRGLVEQLPAIVYTAAFDGPDGAPTLLYVSPQVEDIMGTPPEQALADPWLLAERIPADHRRLIAAAVARLAAGDAAPSVEFRFERPDGTQIWLRHGRGAVVDGPDSLQLHGLLFDITAEKQAQDEHKRMENDLRLAQKLEAVGQLAAGVAHEINTPIQFVGDTLGFLENAFADLLAVQSVHDELCLAADAGAVDSELVARVAKVREDADLDYLRERAPAAFERATDGIQRVAAIVGAMREFAHPPTADHAAMDINAAVRNTLIVAASQYKYVADVETDLADLPPAICNVGEVNQVLLNLVINATHAIEDKGGERGRISILTRRDDEHVLIAIGDSGCGIPADVAGRIFDPFFTTKEVGRGTGQGLALARAMIVDRHGGTLTFETEPGQGTTFHVRLPIGGQAAAGEPHRRAA